MAGSEVTGLLSIVITPNFKEDSVKVRRLWNSDFSRIKPIDCEKSIVGAKHAASPSERDEFLRFVT